MCPPVLLMPLKHSYSLGQRLEMAPAHPANQPLKNRRA
jgi:hypothetical protein